MSTVPSLAGTVLSQNLSTSLAAKVQDVSQKGTVLSDQFLAEEGQISNEAASEKGIQIQWKDAGKGALLMGAALAGSTAAGFFFGGLGSLGAAAIGGFLAWRATGKNVAAAIPVAMLCYWSGTFGSMKPPDLSLATRVGFAGGAGAIGGGLTGLVISRLREGKPLS
ncbi:MAG: hypothetical protein HYU64_19355 [Armatimonadetes bacterium]|nr:hypothetical protein [Armatimonadota bacterium]